MNQKTAETTGIFAPYIKNYGRTTEEQIEKNKPLMDWLKQKIEAGKNLTEEELKSHREYLEHLKQTIDSFRPVGHKLYTEQ